MEGCCPSHINTIARLPSPGTWPRCPHGRSARVGPAPVLRLRARVRCSRQPGVARVRPSHTWGVEVGRQNTRVSLIRGGGGARCLYPAAPRLMRFDATYSPTGAPAILTNRAALGLGGDVDVLVCEVLGERGAWAASRAQSIHHTVYTTLLLRKGTRASSRRHCHHAPARVICPSPEPSSHAMTPSRSHGGPPSQPVPR